MNRSTLFIADGFGLVATCYGLARFAFGLFLPVIASDLALTASSSGLVSGGSFFGYCLAIIASAVLTERFGPRTVAALAGGIGAAGLAGMAAAQTGGAMGVAVLIAGLSTGLASPPLAAAVAASLNRDRQDRAGAASGCVQRTGPKDPRQRSAKHGCQLLMSIPGVGAITASSYVAAIEDPANFKKSRSVGAWFGLTTRRYQSGEVDYDDHISRRGDPICAGSSLRRPRS